MKYLFLLSDCWVIIGSIATVAGAIVAGIYTALTYGLLKKTGDLAKFQMYHQISTSSDKSIFYDYINECKNNTIVNKNNSDIIVNLLNPLEALAKYYEDGFISLKDIRSGYGSSINRIFDNIHVKKLIDTERKNSIGVFDGLVILYHELVKYEEKLSKSQNKK